MAEVLNIQAPGSVSDLDNLAKQIDAAHVEVRAAIPIRVVIGVYPPSQKIEQIPVEDVRTFGISDDATELFDYNNDANRYRDLHIKRKDFMRRLGEIKAKDGA